VDTLILACTHYPLLKETIREYMGDVEIVDSAQAVAQEVKKLARNEGRWDPEALFYRQLAQPKPSYKADPWRGKKLRDHTCTL
jgi:glutamate racemase